MPSELEKLGFDSPIVSKKTNQMLTQFGSRVADDYLLKKRQLLIWLLTKGKDPFDEKGYSPRTIRKTHYKIEKTYRWIWRDLGRYRWRFKPEKANEFLDYLYKYEDDVPQPQIVEYEKAIKLLFKYWTETTDDRINWSYDRTLKQNYSTERDHFRDDELRALYEASLGHNTIRKPDNIKKAEDLRGILARRFDVPKKTISEEDFDRANSWKIPSLIAVANDLGLRPREVKIAKASWMYPDDEVVRIPKDESVKSSSAWTCGLSNQTATALKRWLAERESYTIYHDTDLLWLNASGTPYDNQSLNYLLDKLIEEAGIEEGHRNLTWYSIRHGVATMWANKDGVHYAQEQLRHEKTETTMNYVHGDSDEQSKQADGKW